MHVLFVHRSFPAQFGQLASRLARHEGWRCTFCSEGPARAVGGVECLQYESPDEVAAADGQRTFEVAVERAAAVREALRPRAVELSPDLIVGHSGFGSTLFLGELWPQVPIVGYFEYFFDPHGSFRPDLRSSEADGRRRIARNAMILLDLEQCAAGYSPTEFQRSRMPDAYKRKIRVIHDGIDIRYWRRDEDAQPGELGLDIRPATRLVTYVSPGHDSVRGFDIFMKVARRVCDEYEDVLFAVVGGERPPYGDDSAHTGGRPFKEHVLAQDDYDSSRIRFLGVLPPRALVRLLSLSDLHVYLTAPYVLSWSMLNAMACGCTVLCSDTDPVREVVEDGENGLLCDFFDADGLAARALDVLAEPATFRRTLGRAAERTIVERYSLDAITPRISAFYREVVDDARQRSYARPTG